MSVISEVAVTNKHFCYGLYLGSTKPAYVCSSFGVKMLPHEGFGLLACRSLMPLFLVFLGQPLVD